MGNKQIRCGWVDENNPLYMDYHDNEWGIPVHDDRKLFEMLILEGQQAGLSWITVLKKRENYKKAFDDFDYEKISCYNQEKINSLLLNEGIIRNKLKINSVIKNARIYISLIEKFGTFDEYIWGFVDHKPLVNNLKNLSELPAKSIISDKISKDLKKRGMTFVGSVIMYSFMQAVGMVNDHVIDCFRFKELTK